jgi:hypothetical protein
MVHHGQHSPAVDDHPSHRVEVASNNGHPALIHPPQQANGQQIHHPKLRLKTRYTVHSVDDGEISDDARLSVVLCSDRDRDSGHGSSDERESAASYGSLSPPAAKRWRASSPAPSQQEPGPHDDEEGPDQHILKVENIHLKSKLDQLAFEVENLKHLLVHQQCSGEEGGPGGANKRPATPGSSHRQTPMSSSSPPPRPTSTSYVDVASLKVDPGSPVSCEQE